MRRREFITLLGGAAAAWPLFSRAQTAMPVVGCLDTGEQSDPERWKRNEAFRRGLLERGWIDDRNIKLHLRWGRTQAVAKELLALRPAVIFAESSPAVAALQRETRTVPIVFANVSDPVEAGFIESLARPGGNITGFTNFEYATAGKWLELLKEIAPAVKRVAVLIDPDNPQSAGRLRALAAAVPQLGMQIIPLQVRSAADIENSITQFAPGPGDGLLVPPGSIPLSNRFLIISIAARHRLPAIYANAVFARDGGLLSYGIDAVDQCRQAAGYVDRILRGEKPADLPVQAPTKYELVLNVKTAKALGLDVPATVLTRTDEVIE